MVVLPPPGIVVTKPPPECSVVRLGEISYCYHYGTFYLYDTGLKGYKIVSAPPGVIVKYLPDGKKETHINGVKYYQYSGVFYRPVYVGNDVVFLVVKI